MTDHTSTAIVPGGDNAAHQPLCPGCGHAKHDGMFCEGWSDCDETCGPHPCACDYPNSGNFAWVPERERPIQ